MDELIAYIVNDTRCGLAVQELESGADHFQWVGENMDLFLAISYGGDGLPLIAKCNYQGRRFKNISRFHNLFLKTRESIDDPFSGEE
jgi:hypothetical protein